MLLAAKFSGKAGCVFTMDVVDGRIKNIYVVTNPQKLAALGRRLTDKQ
jgi:hypothetical protein